MSAKPVTHPSREELSAFGLGKLEGAPAATIAAHLEECDTCRRAVEKVSGDSFLELIRRARGPATAPPTRSVSGPAVPAVAGLPPELAEHPKFRIVRALGQGGMGAVYLAEHRLMERQVAIKVITQALLDRPDSLERFRKEVKAAAKL